MARRFVLPRACRSSDSGCDRGTRAPRPVNAPPVMKIIRCACSGATLHQRARRARCPSSRASSGPTGSRRSVRPRETRSSASFALVSAIDVVVLARGSRCSARPDRRLVVDDQDARAMAATSALRSGAFTFSARRGPPARRRGTSCPCRSRSRPRCVRRARVTMPWQIARPSPVPDADGLRREERVEDARRGAPSGCPAPVSETSTTTLPVGRPSWSTRISLRSACPRAWPGPR